MRNVTFQTYATHTWAYICAPANVPTEKTLIAQLQDSAGRFVGVLDKSWKVYGISCLVAVGSAFLYLIFLRLFGSFAVILSAFGIEGILVYSSYRLIVASADPTLYPSDPVMAQSIQALSIITCCSAIIFLLLVMYMAQRLILAGIFLRHASCVLAQLPSLLFVPFLTFGLLVGLFVWGIKVTVSIFGSGSITWNIATVTASSPATIHIMTESFRVDKVLRWFFLYHLWGMYWTLHFNLSIGEMITTTAVSIWYFSENGKKTSKKRLRPSSPVAYAVQSTLLKHLGTLTFSSAIGSLTRLSRSVYVKLQDRSELDASSSIEFFTKCCCCCMWCFDSCLRYVRKEAVYISAIQGSGYYHSAKLAYALLSANLVRYGALDRIGHASVFMGKLIVSVTTCLAFWLYLDKGTSPILPLAITVIFSFSVAHAFMTIYETTIDALLICFTLDESIHGGRGNAVYATGSLTESVNQHLRPKWQTIL
ncbi:unnamed protein product [Albugo candida]|uniref:Choline transporter-like protein n=1 Tax=Albugo candida TaxID=65357 RepID=A0A024G4K7_9STRA|nr:unnamed protein product [Albugo candida]|eukprot:CCI41607.1 unnamed protein product [Albugo candida]